MTLILSNRGGAEADFVLDLSICAADNVIVSMFLDRPFSICEREIRQFTHMGLVKSYEVCGQVTSERDQQEPCPDRFIQVAERIENYLQSFQQHPEVSHEYPLY
jgi:hypothetical protein